IARDRAKSNSLLLCPITAGRAVLSGPRRKRSKEWGPERDAEDRPGTLCYRYKWDLDPQQSSAEGAKLCSPARQRWVGGVRAASPGGAKRCLTPAESHQHVAFSTKHRVKVIPVAIQPKLWFYMAGIRLKGRCRPSGALLTFLRLPSANALG